MRARSTRIWPTRGEEIVVDDGRTWAALAKWLDDRGDSLKARVALLSGVQQKRAGWTEEYIKEQIQRYRSAARRWPTKADGRIQGDGRTWSAADVWLRSRGSNLGAMIEHLGGGRPKFSLSGVRSAGAAYRQKHRQRPTEDSADTAGLPPGATWQMAISWVHNNQKLSMDAVFGQRYFSLADFRVYAAKQTFPSVDAYRKAHKAGKLDSRCPAYPPTHYKLGWLEVLGTPKARPFARAEFERYIRRTTLVGHDLLTWKGYRTAYRAHLLDARCPSYPYAAYENWKWPRKVSRRVPSVGPELVSIVYARKKLREVGLAFFSHRHYLEQRVPGDGRKWATVNTMLIMKHGVTVLNLARKLFGGQAVETARKAVVGVVCGEQIGSSKLTWAAVKEMRALAKQGWTGVSLAKRFGVGGATVSRIVNEHGWRDKAAHT